MNSNNFKIPFSGKSHTYLKEEIDIVNDVMQNAETLTQGKHQKYFEKKFSEFIGVKNSFALSSAASALELTAQLCQFKDGDEVIIPGHTYTASAYPFIKKGAKIIWADIDLKTRVVTPETIESCISSKTRAIVIVHLYGYAADMPNIIKLAKKHNILVIEDTAQALGVNIQGKKAGSFGDFGVFSFHSHKNITTLGEGGMISVNNEEYANLIPLLRHNGHCNFKFERKEYWKPAMGNVDIPILNGETLFPNNYCLSEVQCALGAKLLERINKINIEKRNKAIFFIDSISSFSNLEFHRENTDRHNYHLLAARFITGDRDTFISKMAKEGIQCVVQYFPLYRYDLYKKIGQSDALCPNTDIFFDNMVSFPFQQTLKDKDLEWMIKITKKCLQN